MGPRSPKHFCRSIVTELLFCRYKRLFSIYIGLFCILRICKRALVRLVLVKVSFAEIQGSFAEIQGSFVFCGYVKGPLSALSL